MKKLLALVLCVMLFVSVIPTSAFATNSGSGIDLSPAYEAQNDLYIAYAQLGAATAIKNSILGIRAMENDKNKTTLEDGPVADLISALSEVKNIKTGLSYKGLYDWVASYVGEAYVAVGAAVVTAVAEKITETITDVNTAVDNIIASFPATGN